MKLWLLFLHNRNTCVQDRQIYLKRFPIQSEFFYLPIIPANRRLEIQRDKKDGKTFYKLCSYI